MTHPVFPGTRRRLILLATIMVLAVSGAHAQESLVYDGPVPVRIDGRSVDIPVRISGEATGDGREITLHALVGADDLQPALLALAKDLAGKASKRCELRFSVSDAGMKVDAGQIILSVKARTEVWVCSSFLKTRLGRERAVVQASVIPTVADGRLQLEPTGVTISGVSDLLREVGGEAVMEYLFSQIVDRFNDDPRMNALPQSLAEAGYAYSGVQAGGAFGDNVLRVSITGPNDLLGLWKRTLGAR